MAIHPAYTDTQIWMAIGILPRRALKKEYDFSNGKRGAVLHDNDILNWFRQQVNAAGRGNYQTLISAAPANSNERSN